MPFADANSQSQQEPPEAAVGASAEMKSSTSLQAPNSSSAKTSRPVKLKNMDPYYFGAKNRKKKPQKKHKSGLKNPFGMPPINCTAVLNQPNISTW